MMAVRIRNKMDAMKLTNQALADRSGVPLATVNRIVAGQTENPSIQNLTALAAALEMTLDEMVGLGIRSETPIQPSPVVNAYESMVQTLHDAHSSDLQELRREHAKELQQLEERHRQAMDALERKHTAQVERMEQQHAKSSAAKDRWISRQFWLRIATTVLLFLVMVWALFLELQMSDIGLIRW